MCRHTRSYTPIYFVHARVCVNWIRVDVTWRPALYKFLPSMLNRIHQFSPVTKARAKNDDSYLHTTQYKSHLFVISINYIHIPLCPSWLPEYWSAVASSKLLAKIETNYLQGLSQPELIPLSAIIQQNIVRWGDEF